MVCYMVTTKVAKSMSPIMNAEVLTELNSNSAFAGEKGRGRKSKRLPQYFPPHAQFAGMKMVMVILSSTGTGVILLELSL